MAADISSFSNLSRDEKIDYIKRSSPHLVAFLKENIAQLSPGELSKLIDLANVEINAKELKEEFTSFLKKYVEDFSSKIDPVIDESKLTPDEKNILKNTFTKPLIFAVSYAAKELQSSIKEGKGFLYTTILSEKTVTVLEAILSFKESIDKVFPGLSDKVISIALTGLLSACSPPVALILKSSGVIDVVSDLLSTKTLEATISKMYVSLDKIREDKKLNELNKKGEIIAKISQETKIDLTVIEKFNLTLDGASIMAKELADSNSRSFLNSVAAYAKTNVPSSTKEIDEKMQKVKEATIIALDKSSLSDALKEEAIKIIDKNINNAKVEMNKSIDANSQIGEKIVHVINAAKTLSKVEGQIMALAKGDLNQSAALKQCALILKNEVDKTIKGDVSEMAKTIKGVSKDSDLTKKVIKANAGFNVKINEVARAVSINR